MSCELIVSNFPRIVRLDVPRFGKSGESSAHMHALEHTHTHAHTHTHTYTQSL